MALVKCPDCGNEVSSSAERCTKCGRKIYKMDENDKNRIASILKVISIIIFVGGFIAGIELARDRYDDFVFWQALVYWIMTFIAGMMFMGFSEIVQLLDDIKNK